MMSTIRFPILHKYRATPTGWARLSDYTLGDGQTVSAAAVLTDPSLSLYCLDEPQQQFVFVQTPPTVDLSQAPFFFQAQFEHATHVVTVPFKTMLALAEQSQPDDSALILLYSVGRCGSTLLSEAFNQLPEVASLSEPDVFTDLLRLREPDGSRDAEISELLHACLVALMKPLPPKRPLFWAIKFRSYGVELADLIADRFPHARPLFMYRNAEDWAISTTRAFQKLASDKGAVGTASERAWARRTVHLRRAAHGLLGSSLPKPVRRLIHQFDQKAGILGEHSTRLRTRFFPALRPYLPQLQTGRLTRMEYITLEWVSGMCRYLTLHEQGRHLLAFRYEELIERPEEMLAQLFAYCGLPQTAVSQTLPAFAHDSQRGTSLARTAVRSDTANRLTDAHLQQLRRLLADHPALGTPHVLLPGTIT